MDLKKIGLIVGGLIGFFVGGSITAPGKADATLIRGVTGGAITENLGSVSFSFLLSLIGAVFVAVILATFLMSGEEIVKLIRRQT